MSKILSRKIFLLDNEPAHYCPGCKRIHIINVNKHNSSGAIWNWDKDISSPTFSPSINIPNVCHYFLIKGKIGYCTDSIHRLTGLTVDLPDLPEYILDGYYDNLNVLEDEKIWYQPELD